MRMHLKIFAQFVRINVKSKEDDRGVIQER